MKITHVISACDLNPNYVACIPFFIEAWKVLFPEVNVIIALIANEVPTALMDHQQHFRLFNPIPNIPTAFQAQCIRLLLPGTIPEAEGIIITDIDMLPLNRAYYTKPIEKLPANAFFHYRLPRFPPPRHLYMCYAFASGSVWRDIFWTQGNVVDYIDKTLTRWYSERKGAYRIGSAQSKSWFTDQDRMTEYVARWIEAGKGVYVGGHDKGFKRIDRMRPHVSQAEMKAIERLECSDYHMHRPVHKHEAKIRRVITALKEAAKNNIDPPLQSE